MKMNGSSSSEASMNISSNTSGVVVIPHSSLQVQLVEALNSAYGGSFHSLPPLLLIQITVEAYPRFNMEKAVCNHGFFMMAPNKWDPLSKTLCRPLRLFDNDNSVLVLIRHSLERRLLDVYILNTSTALQNHQIASPPNLLALTDQIKRMLRISSVDEQASTHFQTLYPEAAEDGFCRLFRSPTLFEDIIKSLLLINCGWGRSLDMAQALCELEQEGTTDEDGVSSSESRGLNNFPNSKQVALVDVQYLKDRCKLGFRADVISDIARKVEDGSFSLQHTTPHSAFLDRLLNIHGIGDFVAANVSMCMGFYTCIPIDSETNRHVQRIHGVEEVDKKSIMDVYQKFAPYQCLAYWFEHVRYYESKFGKLSEMNGSSYRMVSSSKFDSLNESPPKKLVKSKKKKGRFSPYKYRRFIRSKF